MKIAAYEVRRDEQKDFAFIAEKLGVELTETEDNLTLVLTAPCSPPSRSAA